jgi:pimeloyl-ACP methyl ester carboxylesterase
MWAVHHRYATVGDQRLFYRDAGPADAPTVVLLHGFPASSFMFRALIPKLAGNYRVIAPDHLGFGFSDSPPVDEFDYTFDALTDLTWQLLTKLGVSSCALYVQDYGAPIGWRLALSHPDAVAAIVSQNGNAYEAGFVDAFWAPVKDYWREENSATEAALRTALTLDAIRWQYLHGVEDASLVSPDTWFHDHAQVSRPGNDAVQLRLFADYATNLDVYPRLHAYFRESHVPLLAVWGRNDEIFAAAGAKAFQDDLPDAEIKLLDGGHFLLESHLDEVISYIRPFLDRELNPDGSSPARVTTPNEEEARNA